MILRAAILSRWLLHAVDDSIFVSKGPSTNTWNLTLCLDWDEEDGREEKMSHFHCLVDKREEKKAKNEGNLSFHAHNLCLPNMSGNGEKSQLATNFLTFISLKITYVPINFCYFLYFIRT